MKLEKRALIIGTASLVVSIIGIVIMLLIAQDWTIRQGERIWNHIIALMSFYLAIAKFLFLTSEGRQIVLSLLVVWFIIWLMLLKKKNRKKKPELNARHRIILESLISNEGRSTSFGLQTDYEKKFGYLDKKDFGICIDDLLELGYIKFIGIAGPGFNIYLMTRAGAKYIKKFIVENEASQ